MEMCVISIPVYNKLMKKGGKHHREEVAETLRVSLFGLEDGIVSTLGALTGIAAGSGSRYIVVLSGLVIIAVESLSMAAGSYLSSKSAFAVISKNKKGEKHLEKRSKMNALLMGVGYIIGGLIPLFPYLYLPIDQALGLAVGLAVSALFAAGAYAAHHTGRRWYRSGIEMVVVSLGAAVIGYLIGLVAKTHFSL